MSARPRLLDLFCKAGGSSMGYHMAGFDVTGLDVDPQPRYPFRFVQADVTTLDPEWLAAHFDAVAGSPPCQPHTDLRARHPDRAYVDLIPPTRTLLRASGLPYVIENVSHRAGLVDPVRVCGSHFGLRVRRHRFFECSWPAVGTPCDHEWQDRDRRYVAFQGPSKGSTRRRTGTVSVHGGSQMEGGDTLRYKSVAMGIDWMTCAELNQAIPPAYTLHLGRQLLAAVTR